MKVYTELYRDLIRDIANGYVDGGSNGNIAAIVDVSDQERHYDELLKYYGMDLLTKILPMYGKALDLALSGKGKPIVIPHLFEWLWLRVLKPDGTLLYSPTGDGLTAQVVEAVKQLRQLLYFAYKLALPYDKSTAQKAIDSFVQTQRELATYEFPEEILPTLHRARKLVARVLCNVNPRDIIPRHGPGAVSTGERNMEKFNFSRISKPLDAVFPFTEYFMVGTTHVADHMYWLNNREFVDAQPAKVVLVNKDSRGPRLISCEPLENQWIQQGLRGSLYDAVESHPLTRGHVNFRDQGVNRELALEGSRKGNWVTLDMKDASDRVSAELVQHLFGDTAVYEGLAASRTRCTRLPDGTIVHLATFAPMGSAVCFPVEAMVFWSLAVAALMHVKGYRLKKARSRIYVYGDDIICDVEDYDVVIRHLELANLRVNESKCCVAGFFRESCGCDAFNGTVVTPIRLRTTWSSSSNTASQLASWVDLSNRLWCAGYWVTATTIRTRVERLYGDLPVKDTLERYSDQGEPIPDSGRVIAWYRPHLDPVPFNRSRGISQRFNTRLFRREVFGYAVKSHRVRARVNGWQRLLATLCGGGAGLLGAWYTVARRSSLVRTWGPA